MLSPDTWEGDDLLDGEEPEAMFAAYRLADGTWITENYDTTDDELAAIATAMIVQGRPIQ